MADLRPPINSDDLIVAPGVTLGQIKHDRDALNAAVVQLDFDIASIKSQLEDDLGVDFSSGTPTEGDPTWRKRANSALRLKKHALATIRLIFTQMNAAKKASPPPAPRPDRDRCAQALLDTLHDELGHAEFERIKTIAKARNPEIFGEVTP